MQKSERFFYSFYWLIKLCCNILLYYLKFKIKYDLQNFSIILVPRIPGSAHTDHKQKLFERPGYDEVTIDNLLKKQLILTKYIVTYKAIN